MRLLGPVEVNHAGLAQPSLRVLLSALALSANRVVSSETLIGAVWQEEASRERERNLHGRVYQLRRLLCAAEPGREQPRLVRATSGYRLELAGPELDVTGRPAPGKTPACDPPVARCCSVSPVTEFAVGPGAQGAQFLAEAAERVRLIPPGLDP